MLTPEEINKLEDLAKAATPGRWSESIWTGRIEWPDGVRATIMAHGPMHLYKEINEEAIADAEFIAAANPATILTMISTLRRYRDAFKAGHSSRDEEVAELKQCIEDHSAEWEAICDQNHRADKLESKLTAYESMLGEMETALSFYADKKAWHDIIVGGDLGHNIKDGDQAEVFEKGEGSAAYTAHSALTRLAEFRKEMG